MSLTAPAISGTVNEIALGGHELRIWLGAAGVGSDSGAPDGSVGAVGTSPADAAMTAASERATGEAVPPTVRTAPPRRRPTGAPPPLPRQLGTSGKLWI